MAWQAATRVPRPARRRRSMAWHGGMMGMARRALVALLVLAVLALAVPSLAVSPMMASPVVSTADHGGGHHAMADCGQVEHQVEQGQSGPCAVPAGSSQEPARGHHAPPGQACCLALQCPMLLADLPGAKPAFMPVAERVEDAALPTRQPAGLDIPPALPPPRDAA